MKSYSLSDLRFVAPSTLRSWFGGKSPTGNGNFAVVDVRDSDYIGGHIRGCYHYPAGNFHETLPELRKRILDNQIDDVVFHCALSQVRGPKSSLMFLRSLQELPEDQQASFLSLNVWVLSGGFTKWQRLYGKDALVTEDFQADLWDKA